MLGYVPLTKSKRAVLYLRYPLQSTSMTSVMLFEANSPNNLQTMLHRLKAYACGKFLTVNTWHLLTKCQHFL
eukprot:215701-Pelagomonas_calceolata.AAC.3